VEPFLSSTEVATKRVKVTVKVSCCEQPLTFKVTYIPGCPHRLHFLSPSDGHMFVPNGNVIEPVILACFDEYGNQCAPTPQFGSKWYLQLDENGPVTSEVERFSVEADGTVTLNELLVEVDTRVTYPGVGVSQLLYLEVSGRSRSAGPKRRIEVRLDLTVTPGIRPSSMEVCCPFVSLTNLLQVLYEEESLVNGIRLPVGTLMTGLTLQIMTENMDHWELSTNSSVEISADWKKSPSRNKRKQKKKKSSKAHTLENPETALCLPDIQVTYLHHLLLCPRDPFCSCQLI
jgi:hypothetical protein